MNAAVGALLLVAALSFVALGLATTAWLVPLALDRLNRLVDSEVRATVLSVSGMVSRVFLVICFPIFGAIVVMVGTVSVLWYFFFSVEHKRASGAVRS